MFGPPAALICPPATDGKPLPPLDPNERFPLPFPAPPTKSPPDAEPLLSPPLSPDEPEAANIWPSDLAQAAAMVANPKGKSRARVSPRKVNPSRTRSVRSRTVRGNTYHASSAFRPETWYKIIIDWSRLSRRQGSARARRSPHFQRVVGHGRARSHPPAVCDIAKEISVAYL